MFTSLPKRLAAFDFDHTIVDDNTCCVIRRLLPPSEVVKYSCTNFKCWTFYMQDIFYKLHQRNVSDLDITNEIIKIQPVSGMKTLIKKLKDGLNFDIIIISDSNTLFIDKWLSSVGLKDYILQVFSNPAQFVDQQLQIKPYHEQTDCKLSPYNMCKYRILNEFIQSQKQNNVNYSAIYYFGDGSNDFCPISQLSTNDVGCVRSGYECLDMLQKFILKQPKNILEHHILPEIFIWNDGHDLLKFISAKVK